MSSQVGLVGARNDWLVPRGLLGEVWVDSWLSWGGSLRLAVTCSGSCGFATRVVGSLGRLATACGACGRMEILGDLLGSCWFLCGLAAIRGELVATLGVS